MKYFFLGLIISILYSFLILPRSEKLVPKIKFTLYPLFYKGMLILPLNKNKALHIHHWVIYLIIYLLFSKYPLIKGLSLGLFLQGLSYIDRFNFIIRNPYELIN